jgi:hypothetical protein
MRLLVVDPKDLDIDLAIRDVLLAPQNSITYASSISVLIFPFSEDTVYPDWEAEEQVYNVLPDGRYYRLLCGLA